MVLGGQNASIGRLIIPGGADMKAARVLRFGPPSVIETPRLRFFAQIFRQSQLPQVSLLRLLGSDSAVGVGFGFDFPNPLFPQFLSVERLSFFTDFADSCSFKKVLICELFTDALRGVQYHIQHFIRFGEHRNMTAL